MSVAVGVVLAGLVACCGALVWLWGPWGLLVGGCLLIVVGVVPDWERVNGEHSPPTPR